MGKWWQGFFKLSVMALLAMMVLSIAFLAGFWCGASEAPFLSPAGAEPPEFEVFWEAWRILEREFYGDLPEPREMTYGAIRGVISLLNDAHTVFIDPERAAILEQDITGSFEGIGALVDMREDGKLVIVEPFEGMPAAKAGLRRGDVILKVNDTPIQNMTVFEAVALIRGPAGTAVRLTIQREGVPEPFEVTVIRQKIEIPVLTSRMLEHSIAYIKLTEFNAQADEKLEVALKALLVQNPRGLILDLRDNPGGLLDEAIEVASEFIDEGNILQERFKGGQVKDYPAQKGGIALDIPLVVLVDRGTASASEIVAGAIQDYGRGILVGERTFGKGSVQLPHTLRDGSQLRVTVARWFTPKGRLIHGQGLEPDIVVERTEEDVLAGRDPQLERAIQFLLTGK